MVLEVATINIKPGTQREFEEAFVDVADLLVAADGCYDVQLQRCTEVVDRYAVLIHWESVEHHNRFREKEGRISGAPSPISAFYSEPAVGHHFELVLNTPG
jgi:heme-degrading monooxygenase HmoA